MSPAVAQQDKGYLSALAPICCLSCPWKKAMWTGFLNGQRTSLALTCCTVSWEGKVIQYIWKWLLLSVIMRHSLDSFQELRTKGTNDAVSLQNSVLSIFHKKTAFSIFLFWNMSQWSLWLSEFSLSQLGVAVRGFFVEVKWNHQPIWSEVLFLLRITNCRRWETAQHCECVAMHYFGAMLRRQQPNCQSGFLCERNVGGQGCSKTLIDTRALM